MLTEVDPPIPGLTFGQPQVGVYFREDPERADIITTWNSQHRTAAGIGPCSTIDEMKRAYGKSVQPNPHGVSPDGKTVHQWVVGPNLMFATSGSENHLCGGAVPRIAPQYGAQPSSGLGGLRRRGRDSLSLGAARSRSST